MISGYSGVRLLDGLAHQPRSKSFLNGKQLLIAGAGRRIVLAQAEDGTAEAPTRVMIYPINQFYESTIYDFEKDKFTTYKIKTTREWLEKLKANTLLVWGDKEIPWYLHHNRYDEAHGWTPVAGLEIDDEGMWAHPEWIGDTAEKIVEKRYRYVSPGWDPLFKGSDGKVLGEVLYETSLTNSPYFTAQPGLAAAAGDLIIAAAVPVDAAAQDEEAEMLEKLRGLLGLSAEATEEEIGTAVMAAVAAGAELAEIDKALESVEGADRAAKLATLTTAKPAEKEPEVKPDPEKGTTDPEKGTAGMGAAAAKILVGAAVKAGQIPPAEEAQFVADFAVLSLDAAERVLGLMGASVPKGGDLKGKADGGAEGYRPSKKQLRACSLSEADWEKYGNLKEEGGDED